MVRIVAYYGNVMLLSSFLGLGCGVLLARRKLRLQRLFAPLLLLFVPSLSLLARVRFTQGPDELRFLFEGGAMTTTLPIVTLFFAGIVFSSTFSESADTGFSFGSNMLGAMFGGLVEYLGMITGSRALLLVVLGFYAARLTVRWLGLRAQSGGAGAAGGFQTSATSSNSAMM